MSGFGDLPTLGVEELDFLSSLLRFLNSQETWVEGLILDVRISVDYNERPSFTLDSSDYTTWFLKPYEE